MQNPVRRNKKIGVKKQEHSNTFVPPKIGSLLRPTQSVVLNNIIYIIEKPDKGYTYSCTPQEVDAVIHKLPTQDIEGIVFVVFHQPTKKQGALMPTWAEYFDPLVRGKRQGAAILISAMGQVPRKWPLTLQPQDLQELEKLKQEGHIVTKTRDYYLIESPQKAVKQTQLYRSVVHEVGHHVAYKKGISKKKNEEYARKYEHDHQLHQD